MLSDLDAAAVELVTEFGGIGTYSNVTPGVPVPGVGVVNTTVTQSAKMALVDLTLQSNGLALKAGITEILAGDKEAYMIPPVRTGGTAINVNPGTDKVVFGGIEYTVVTFKEINPTGTLPIVYFLYLRR